MAKKLLLKILIISLVVAVITLMVIGIIYFSSDEHKAKQRAKRKDCETLGGNYCSISLKGDCVLDCNRLEGKYFRYFQRGFGLPSCSCIINKELKSIW